MYDYEDDKFESEAAEFRDKPSNADLRIRALPSQAQKMTERPEVDIDRDVDDDPLITEIQNEGIDAITKEIKRVHQNIHQNREEKRSQHMAKLEVLAALSESSKSNGPTTRSNSSNKNIKNGNITQLNLPPKTSHVPLYKRPNSANSNNNTSRTDTSIMSSRPNSRLSTARLSSSRLSTSRLFSTLTTINDSANNDNNANNNNNNNNNNNIDNNQFQLQLEYIYKLEDNLHNEAISRKKLLIYLRKSETNVLKWKTKCEILQDKLDDKEKTIESLQDTIKSLELQLTLMDEKTMELKNKLVRCNKVVDSAERPSTAPGMPSLDTLRNKRNGSLKLSPNNENPPSHLLSLQYPSHHSHSHSNSNSYTSSGNNSQSHSYDEYESHYQPPVMPYYESLHTKNTNTTTSSSGYNTTYPTLNHRTIPLSSHTHSPTHTHTHMNDTTSSLKMSKITKSTSVKSDISDIFHTKHPNSRDYIHGNTATLDMIHHATTARPHTAGSSTTNGNMSSPTKTHTTLFSSGNNGGSGVGGSKGINNNSPVREQKKFYDIAEEVITLESVEKKLNKSQGIKEKWTSTKLDKLLSTRKI